MFVRFRSQGQRLYLSLVETERANGKSRQNHVAALGSLADPSSVTDRAIFWTELGPRLARLSNRVDAGAQTAILAAIHARFPMATTAERQAAQIDAARIDESFWAKIEDMQAELAEGHRQVAAKATNQAQEAEAAAADAKEHRDRAKARIADIEAGKLGSDRHPPTREELWKLIGWTERDQQHADRLQMIEQILGADGLDRLAEYLTKGNKRSERVRTRRFLLGLIR
jgi:hypothetical protein